MVDVGITIGRRSAAIRPAKPLPNDPNSALDLFFEPLPLSRPVAFLGVEEQVALSSASADHGFDRVVEQ